MDYKVNKEAVDKIIERVLDNGSTVINKNVLEEMFPELEESEDEKIRKEIIGVLSTYEHDRDLRNAAIAWLEKQGEIIREWSEMKINRIQKELQEMVDLKHKTEQGEQKPTWSEEDEKMIGNIRIIIEQYAFSQSAVDVNGELCEKEYIEADNWLKSLRPQNRWKPSEHEITVLEKIQHGEINPSNPTLHRVIKCLKKLMEE